MKLGYWLNCFSLTKGDEFEVNLYNQIGGLVAEDIDIHNLSLEMGNLEVISVELYSYGGEGDYHGPFLKIIVKDGN